MSKTLSVEGEVSVENTKKNLKFKNQIEYLHCIGTCIIVHRSFYTTTSYFFDICLKVMFIFKDIGRYYLEEFGYYNSEK